MVLSSQATTASADVSDDDANVVREPTALEPDIQNPRNKTTTQHDKHNKLDAIVKWVDQGQPRQQSGLMFDLQYHATYNTAFFKLRASVAIKSSSTPEQVPLFVFIAPENIRTLSFDGSVTQDLGPDTVCLHFELNVDTAAAPTLIIPKAMDPLNITWMKKQSSDVWEALQSLVRAKTFDVLCRLPRRAMSEARLASLCDALSSHETMSTPGYSDLGGLYGGKGGKMIRLDSEIEVQADYRLEESPPAYQNLEPGPPMPPINEEKTSNKRRRGNSDAESRLYLDKPRNNLESTIAWLVTELKECKAREASLIVEVKDLSMKVAMLASQQERHRAKCTLLDDDLHDRIGSVENKLDELDEELEVRVDSRIDDALDQKSDSIREELVDYIDETMPNRIQGALEEVTFSARF